MMRMAVPRLYNEIGAFESTSAVAISWKSRDPALQWLPAAGTRCSYKEVLVLGSEYHLDVQG